MCDGNKTRKGEGQAGHKVSALIGNSGFSGMVTVKHAAFFFLMELSNAIPIVLSLTLLEINICDIMG